MDFPEVAYEEVYTEAELERIAAQFGRVAKDRYLDHAGATLYAEGHIKAVTGTLLGNLFGNPHSRNPSSSLSTDAIDSIRLRILAHFGATPDAYSVIFTSGATAALKLLATTFTFDGGPFVYMEESHTSVVGMREVVGAATPCGGSYAVPYGVLEQLLQNSQPPGVVPGNAVPGRRDKKVGNGLVAFPAQCNFSGSKYSLEWIRRIQAGQLSGGALAEYSIDGGGGGVIGNGNEVGWAVLLDGAAFVGTNYLDLSRFPADFISISFYKMFGFPTGLGALLVRKASGHLLKKAYIGGGTVEVLIPSTNFHVPRRELHERFEDGTVDFLSILSLGSAFDTMLSLGLSLDKMSSRTFALCQYAYRVLSSMRHSNGQPVAQIYTLSPFDSKATSGHILTFNLLADDGAFIGYSQVEEIAFLHKVHLRYGCFCNPGACRKFLAYEPADLLAHHAAGHVCGDLKDLVGGRPTGAVRLSVGYMTPKADVDYFLRLVHSTWVKGEVKGSRALLHQPHPDLINDTAHLTHIFIYPIKSCAPFQVSSGTWELSEGGLTFDRQWLIVNSLGVGLSQKREPRLVLIQPRIDLTSRQLEICATGYPSVSIPLDETGDEELGSSEICNSKVCGEKVVGFNCGSAVADWLEKVLEQPGLKLIKILPNRTQRPRPYGHGLSLANDSQYLLLSSGSLLHLAATLHAKGTLFSDSDSDPEGPSSDKVIKKSARNLTRRFRPNLVVNWWSPYEEETWDEIQIGQVSFKSGGPCTRCGTVCTDQRSGQRSSEPLLTLSARTKGSPRFGIHLYATASSSPAISTPLRLSIGDPLVIKSHRDSTSATVPTTSKTAAVLPPKERPPFEVNQNLIASID